MNKFRFDRLFRIQEQIFQPIVEGKSVFGISSPGTGKTLAYLVPLVERLLRERRKRDNLALILLPNSQLCRQTGQELQKLNPSLGFSLGSEASRGIIRICEPHQASPKTSYEYLVLDEVDELSKSWKTLKKIVEKMEKKQILLVGSELKSRSKKKLELVFDFNEFLQVDCREKDSKNYYSVFSEKLGRTRILRQLVHSMENPSLIFSDDELFLKNSASVNSRQDPFDSQKSIQNFLSFRVKRLITDSSLKIGFDSPAENVIFPRPPKKEEFLQASGRVGRGFREGNVYVLYESSEIEKFKKLTKLANFQTLRLDAKPGSIVDLEKAADERVLELARKLIEEEGFSALASGMALIEGRMSVEKTGRSLLTSEKNFLTVRLEEDFEKIEDVREKLKKTLPKRAFGHLALSDEGWLADIHQNFVKKISGSLIEKLPRLRGPPKT